MCLAAPYNQIYGSNVYKWTRTVICTVTVRHPHSDYGPEPAVLRYSCTKIVLTLYSSPFDLMAAWSALKPGNPSIRSRLRSLAIYTCRGIGKCGLGIQPLEYHWYMLQKLCSFYLSVSFSACPGSFTETAVHVSIWKTDPILKVHGPAAQSSSDYYSLFIHHSASSGKYCFNRISQNNTSISRKVHFNLQL